MSNNFQFRVPSIANYDVKYYFADTPDEYPPRIFPFHLHDRIEMYILLEGDVSFAVESSVYKLSAGDAVITKPNEMHNCILNTKSVHKHICLWFDPADAFLFDAFLTHDFGKNNHIVPSSKAKEELFLALDALRDASQVGAVHRQFYLTLQVLDVYRRFMSDAVEPQVLPEVLAKILSDMDENFKTIHSVEYFTSKYFISQSTLNRLFRTYLHSSPKKYLETKRLAYSRVLLNRGKTVLDACMEAGFPDYSNYIRLFKKRFDMTPRQYQNGEK